MKNKDTKTDARLPVGETIENWQAASVISASVIEGTFCQLEKLDIEKHSEALYAAFAKDSDAKNWTYLPYGPFDNHTAFKQWLTTYGKSADPYFFAVMVNGVAVGMLSYLRIDEAIGSIEIGHIHFSPLLQRTTASTEATYLLMAHAFAQNYRRLEWKCDALNNASCNAATRLRFNYEGTFRQASIYKNRNRDTAWYAIIDKDWDAINKQFVAWLDSANQIDGVQVKSLAKMNILKL